MDSNTLPTTIVTSTPLDLLILGWLDAKFKKSRSSKTYRAYETTIAEFRSALQRQGIDLDHQDDQALTTIAFTAQAYSSFSKRGREVARSTINQRLAILSSFYEYAIRQAVLKSNPIKRVERSTVEQYAGAQPLDNTTIETHLAAIDRSTLPGKRDYALLSILLSTGRRLAEVTNLKMQDLTVIAGKVTATFHAKRGKTMIDTLAYPVSYALLDWLQTFYGTDSVPGKAGDVRPVWVSLVNRKHKGGETRIGDALGWQSVADICEKRLGVSKVHSTRHTWAHGMKKIGASVSDIQDRLGHESLATTGRYLKSLDRAENPYADKLSAHLGIR